jgi:Zn-dependent peptidase ImmA (M78 family)
VRDQYPLGIRGPRYELARDRARGLLTLTRQRPPIDVKAIIERANIPVVERVLVDGVRGTIGHVAGNRAIILNRRHRFSSQQERRWVLAEELGHVLLDHKLVESTDPGQPVIGLLEERRVIYEREARAFAAELLMPFFEVRKRWFAISQERPVEGELSLEKRIERLAAEFDVTPVAMRVRLQQMKMLPA